MNTFNNVLEGAVSHLLLPNSPAGKHVLALTFNSTIVLVVCILGRLGRWPGGACSIALFVLAPGICIGHWFMRPDFATPIIRIAIVGVISTLVYWPVTLYAIKSFLDRKRMLRSLTPKHILSAFAIGFISSALVYELNRVSPLVFGILTVPASILDPFGMLLQAEHWMLHWWVPLHLVGGCISYGMIALVVLYRIVWHRGVDCAQLRHEVDGPSA